MTLWTQFKEILKLFGLEYFGRYYSFYRGVVYDNEDPENLGRLRIKCPQIYGNVSPNYWAYPKGMHVGSFFIPQVNDPVYISFESGNVRYPCWEYGWYYTGKSPAGASPTNFMYQTPKGQRIEFNDDEEKITITNKGGFIVDLTKDGIKIHNGSESLKKSMDDLYAEIKLITVPTPLGPSGTPINATKFDTLLQNLKKILI